MDMYYKTLLFVWEDWDAGVGDAVTILAFSMDNSTWSWVREVCVVQWLDSDTFVGQDVDSGELFAVEVERPYRPPASNTGVNSNQTVASEAEQQEVGHALE